MVHVARAASRLEIQQMGKVFLGSRGFVRIAVVLGEVAGQPVLFPLVGVLVLIWVTLRSAPTTVSTR